jgi:hypothetical protein
MKKIIITLAIVIVIVTWQFANADTAPDTLPPTGFHVVQQDEPQAIDMEQQPDCNLHTRRPIHPHPNPTPIPPAFLLLVSGVGVLLIHRRKK